MAAMEPRELREELITDKTVPRAEFERSRLTHVSCTIVLGISWIIGLGCIFGGGTKLEYAASNNGFLPIAITQRGFQIYTLLLNIGVTILTEPMGLIHSTALRWALKERLIFNSNLRLFTTVREYWAFGRISNFFSFGFLALCYCANSLVFASSPSNSVCEAIMSQGVGAHNRCSDDKKEFSAVVNPSAILALGIGLVGKAAITTWQMIVMKVPTWSTTPIETSWACTAGGQRTRVSDRCLMSVSARHEETRPQQPQKHQSPAWFASKDVRRVIAYLWTLFAFELLFFGIITAIINKKYAFCIGSKGTNPCGSYKGNSWNLLPDTGGTTSLVQIDTVVNIDTESKKAGQQVAGGMTPTFLILLALQSLLTLGLHCAELVVTMSRDEDIWRTLYTKSGYTPNSALLVVLKSPKSLLLLALKPFVHWLYSLSLTYYFEWGIFIRPPQILYMALSVLVLAVFCTILCFVRPRGPQPAAFGNIQTLVDLVDCYGRRMWWGHKGSVNGVSHAGTATTPLPKLHEGEWYAGEMVKDR